MEKITLTEIARQMGISVAIVPNWVSTKKRPNWYRAKEIARITGTDPVMWVDSTEKKIRQAIRHEK